MRTAPIEGRRADENRSDQELALSNPRRRPTQANCNRDLLLEISPYETDGGERVGKSPADVPSEILSLYYREKNPLKAIRARCLDCCCDSPTEVRKCSAVDCPSWPFRMGMNPFRAKRQFSDQQKREMAQRLSRKAIHGGTPAAANSSRVYSSTSNRKSQNQD
jgi:hypothetical protein